jgi:hypothetical protein
MKKNTACCGSSTFGRKFLRVFFDSPKVVFSVGGFKTMVIIRVRVISSIVFCGMVTGPY